jgi:TonB-linked SusC/RagA family outer membrane protein
MTRIAIGKSGAFTKTLLIMKLTAILLLTLCLGASAGGRAQEVTLNENNVSLKRLFEEMRKQTGYFFFYDLKEIRTSRPVTIAVRNTGLREALDLCFKDQPLTYTIVDKTVVVRKKEEKPSPASPGVEASPAAVVVVTGTVTNARGEPLEGVTIYIQGTKVGTVTDSKGHFKLTVPAGDKAVLEFSIVGYVSQTVSTDGRTDLQVVLKEGASDLNEIVVVGYGTQRKENLTGAVAMVNARELDSRPLVNLAQGLQGLVPNLNITLNDGKPGTAASYNVRGITSLNAGYNQQGGALNGLGGPLIMVDGVQMDPNLINPADVESVTVLKDAASAAIYGSRGAFGVILITTKNARKNSPLRLNYTGSYTETRPTRLPKYLNSVDYIAMHREADRDGQISGGTTASLPFTVEDSIMAGNYFADPKHNPTGYPDPANPAIYRYVGNTDWIKLEYPGWAPQQQHNISVSGGSDKTSFVGSIGVFDEKGILKPAHSDYQRINPSLRINTEATSWLNLNLKATVNHISSNNPTAQQNGNANSYIQGDSRPNMPVFNPGGTDYSGEGSWTNSLAVLAQNGRDRLMANDIWLTAGAVLTPVDHVKINADYTFNNYSASEQQVQIEFPEYGVDHVFIDYYPWTIPNATTEIGTSNNYTALNLYANYENTFGKLHYVKLTAGYNQEYRHYKTIDTKAGLLIDPGTPFIGLNADPKPSVTGNDYEWAMNGLLYRLNYAFNNRYLLEVDGRYDGSSSFPSGRRYVWSPSASAGWKISEEKFFERFAGAVQELKVRASYGSLPNQLFNPTTPYDATIYPYIAPLPTGNSNYVFGTQQSIAVGSPGLVSPNFTWERVVTRDAGLDFALLQQRLSGAFDVYIRDTRNMLVGGQPLPTVLGTTPPLENAANLRTKGWELSLTWKDKVGRDFSYSATLGLSDYTATITKYDLNPTKVFSSPYQGQHFGEIWGFVTDGYFQNASEAAAANQSQIYGGTLLPGDIRYKDLNGDKQISYGSNTVSNPGDQKIIGNSTPRYAFGLNLYAKYKSFDAAIFFQGVAKRDYMPNDNSFWGFTSEWSIPFVYQKDHWEPNHTNAYYPVLRFGGGGNYLPQTKYLQNAAYTRLKNLALGYTVPARVVNRAHLKSLRVYAAGQNLFEITKLFKGYDPETVGYGIYPLSRAVSFGLQLGL